MYSVVLPLIPNLPQVKIRNRCYYWDLLGPVPTTQHQSTLTINNREKLVLPKPQFAFTLTQNSDKYGSEFQAMAFGLEPPVLDIRAKDDSPYYRMEPGYLAGNYETADMLLDATFNFYRILGFDYRVAEKFRAMADFIEQDIGYYVHTAHRGPKKVITAESDLSEML